MPELPEVERVRLSLSGRLCGRRVMRVEVRRADVVTAEARRPSLTDALLRGETITHLSRHGKQLAICAAGNGDGRSGRPCVCVHLGMSGSLVCRSPATDGGELPPHTHIIWRLDDGSALHFRDPRRFGGVWTYRNEARLHAARWGKLGPDALRITPRTLLASFQSTRRAVKAALLDQHVLAGLGNIYVDELLHRVGIHPATPASRLGHDRVSPLVRAMRRLLEQAIRAGGSSLRDYVDGAGSPGGFQLRHRVYGRANLPCRNCHAPLRSSLIAGRTSVWCENCQPRM